MTCYSHKWKVDYLTFNRLIVLNGQLGQKERFPPLVYKTLPSPVSFLNENEIFQAITLYFLSASVVWFWFLWLPPILHVVKHSVLADVHQNSGRTYCLYQHGRCDLSSNPTWYNPEAHIKKSHCSVNVKMVNSLELPVDIKVFKATSTVLWSQVSADFYSRIYFSRLTLELQWPWM